MALVLLTGCKSNKNQIESPSPINKLDEDEIGKDTCYIVPSGDTIEERYQTLEGFKRVEVEKDSLGGVFEKSKAKALWRKGFIL